MFNVGEILAKIQHYRFPIAGFFDPHLNIAEMTTEDGLIEFVQNSLKNSTVSTYLSTKCLEKISYYLKKFKTHLPDESEPHLVHGDFDPANILVDKKYGQWQITGILDWEFSFSGSPLWDIANMLRYAHHMPAQFETSFLNGVQEAFTLPEHWRISVLLLNLSSLLDCLARSQIGKSPRQCEDICELINHISMQLDSPI